MASTKLTPISEIGRNMAACSDKLKMHKGHKGLREKITEMASAVSAQSPFMKKAYDAGAKYAEESLTNNTSGDSDSQISDNENESEKIIDILRRGWPDPLAKAKREYRGPDRDRDHAEKMEQDYYGYRQRAQLNSVSPETTI